MKQPIAWPASGKPYIYTRPNSVLSGGVINMPTKHDRVARHLAQKYGVEYNKGKGADVKAPNIAIEVETPESLKKDGLDQLQGHRKPSYVAMTEDADIDVALETTKGKKVGVMGPRGNIVKRSTRRR